MARDGQLSRLLLQWLGARQEGRSVSAEELCADCPDLAEALERHLRLVGASIPAEANGAAATPASSSAPTTRSSSDVEHGLPPGSVPLPAVPGYQIVGVLGRGGMGVVYLARQVGLDRLVALKMMLGPYPDPEQLSRFRREAPSVAKLRHANIVQVYDVGEHAGCPYYSMEFIEGGTLAAQLTGKPMPLPRATELIETLARAVHVAHLDGVIHRDLKPGNVLLTLEGVPKITDFGIAKRLDADPNQTRTGAVLGTPSYMAPEQAGGVTRRITPAVDVYALGAILYELLTGRPPFRAESRELTICDVLSKPPVPPRRLNPALPPALEAICLKCLEKEPGRRYTDAQQVAEELKRYRGGQPVEATAKGVRHRAMNWLRARPVPWAGAALGVLVVGLLAYTWWPGGGDNGGIPAPTSPAQGAGAEPADTRTVWNLLPVSLHPPAPAPTTWAVIIAVGRHDNAGIPNLRYCQADADLLAKTFRERGGIPGERILVMSDDSQGEMRPTHDNILNRVPKFLNQAGPTDTVIVAYSGNGIRHQDLTLLVPADFCLTRMEKGIPLTLLRRTLEQSPAAVKVFTFDGCHATDPLGQDLAPHVVTLGACGAEQKCLEWSARQQGLYTYWLARGLEGAADLNSDAVITADELPQFTERPVRPVARRLQNLEQQPEMTRGPKAPVQVPILQLQPEEPEAALKRAAERLGEICTLLEAGELDASAEFTGPRDDPQPQHVRDFGRMATLLLRHRLDQFPSRSFKVTGRLKDEFERIKQHFKLNDPPRGAPEKPGRASPQRGVRPRSSIGDVKVETIGTSYKLVGQYRPTPDNQRLLIHVRVQGGEVVIATFTVVIRMEDVVEASKGWRQYNELQRFLDAPR